MNVGDYIKQLRIERNLSQEELGKLLGVQRAAVQKWESGKVQNLKRETIKKLSEIFHVTPSSFIIGNDYYVNPVLDIVNEIDQDILENTNGNLYEAYELQHKRNMSIDITDDLKKHKSIQINGYYLLDDEDKKIVNDLVQSLLSKDKYKSPSKKDVG